MNNVKMFPGVKDAESRSSHMQLYKDFDKELSELIDRHCENGLPIEMVVMALEFAKMGIGFGICCELTED